MARKWAWWVWRFWIAFISHKHGFQQPNIKRHCLEQAWSLVHRIILTIPKNYAHLKASKSVSCIVTIISPSRWCLCVFPSETHGANIWFPASRRSQQLQITGSLGSVSTYEFIHTNLRIRTQNFMILTYRKTFYPEKSFPHNCLFLLYMLLLAITKPIWEIAVALSGVVSWQSIVKPPLHPVFMLYPHELWPFAASSSDFSHKPPNMRIKSPGYNKRITTSHIHGLRTYLLQSLTSSSRDRKTGAGHGWIPGNRGSRETERKRRWKKKEKSQKIHFMNHPWIFWAVGKPYQMQPPSWFLSIS